MIENIESTTKCYVIANMAWRVRDLAALLAAKLIRVSAAELNLLSCEALGMADNRCTLTMFVSQSKVVTTALFNTFRFFSCPPSLLLPSKVKLIMVVCRISFHRYAHTHCHYVLQAE